LEDYKSAINDCNMAIKINPQYGFAYLNRGIAREMLRYAEEACSDWKKASDLGVVSAKSYLTNDCGGK
ncbi:MAG: hypothetical protein HYY40_05805, partial [Bacteroidetes bacterium]|nr:hypothetical protein [Bacteroidota bacterium]